MVKPPVNWVVAARWKSEPDTLMMQVYGPFSTRKAATAFLRTFDKSWRGEVFVLFDPGAAFPPYDSEASRRG